MVITLYNFNGMFSYCINSLKIIEYKIFLPQRNIFVSLLTKMLKQYDQI